MPTLIFCFLREGVGGWCNLESCGATMSGTRTQANARQVYIVRLPHQWDWSPLWHWYPKNIRRRYRGLFGKSSHPRRYNLQFQERTTSHRQSFVMKKRRLLCGGLLTGTSFCARPFEVLIQVLQRNHKKFFLGTAARLWQPGTYRETLNNSFLLIAYLHSNAACKAYQL